VIVTPVKHNLDLLKSDLIRSPGVHASDIYGSLYAGLDPKRYDYEGLPNPLLLALGTAWEKHFEYLLKANGLSIIRPEELMSPEGIAYSPDLLMFEGVTRLGELKYTSKSAKGMPTEVSNNLPTHADKWLCQMMLYSFWLELTEGWLAILFNYQPWNPDLRVFDLQWTEQELGDNHRTCMNHARHVGLIP